MIQELLYTSHKGEGLKRGSGGGFCTVVCTQGMAPNIVRHLEQLSGYKHPFDVHDTRAAKNPLLYRCKPTTIGGTKYVSLSRISDVKGDYSGRSNKLAHHILLTQDELTEAGPASVLKRSGIFIEKWDGKVKEVPQRNSSAIVSKSFVGPCATWKAVTGDAGWAGVVAERLTRRGADGFVRVIFPLGMDCLGLVEEVFSLLPKSKRWQTGFSTYVSDSANPCALEFLLDGTREASVLRKDRRKFVIDLCKPMEAPAPSDYVTAARSGETAKLHQKPKSPVRTNSPSPSLNAEDDEVEVEAEHGLLLAPPEVQDHAARVRRKREIASDRGLRNQSFRPKKKSYLIPILVTSALLMLLLVGGGLALFMGTGLFNAEHNVAMGDGTEKETELLILESVEQTSKSVEPTEEDSNIAENGLNFLDMNWLSMNWSSLSDDLPPNELEKLFLVTETPDLKPPSSKEKLQVPEDAPKPIAAPPIFKYEPTINLKIPRQKEWDFSHADGGPAKNSFLGKYLPIDQEVKLELKEEFVALTKEKGIEFVRESDNHWEFRAIFRDDFLPVAEIRAVEGRMLFSWLVPSGANDNPSKNEPELFPIRFLEFNLTLKDESEHEVILSQALSAKTNFESLGATKKHEVKTDVEAGELVKMIYESFELDEVKIKFKLNEPNDGWRVNTPSKNSSKTEIELERILNVDFPFAAKPVMGARGKKKVEDGPRGDENDQNVPIKLWLTYSLDSEKGKDSQQQKEKPPQLKRITKIQVPYEIPTYEQAFQQKGLTTKMQRIALEEEHSKMLRRICNSIGESGGAPVSCIFYLEVGENRHKKELLIISDGKPESDWSKYDKSAKQAEVP